MVHPARFGLPQEVARAARRLLLVFDGGDSPGYASVAVALTEEASRRGYEVWAATEGFRSLTRDTSAEPRFERLIVGRSERYKLLAEGVPVRSMGRRVLDAGSDFRSERYLGFLDHDRRVEAAQSVAAQGFTHLVCVGGNGTLEGTRALLAELDPKLPTGFVNVSIDNDLGGDRAIGFVSGIEAGATVARGLYEDAYTHKRVYILEMMGNRSGRHALHCGVAARAHLIILPFFKLSAEVLSEMATALSRASYALVVVAEGYESERRAKGRHKVSASEFFRQQLHDAGLEDSPRKRVIAEPFSRYIRGVRPAFLDVSASFLKASLLLTAFDEGRTEVMPFVLAAHDVGLRGFKEVAREDGVEAPFMPLLSRLELPRFQHWLHERFKPSH